MLDIEFDAKAVAVRDIRSLVEGVGGGVITFVRVRLSASDSVSDFTADVVYEPVRDGDASNDIDLVADKVVLMDFDAELLCVWSMDHVIVRLVESAPEDVPVALVEMEKLSSLVIDRVREME